MIQAIRKAKHSTKHKKSMRKSRSSGRKTKSNMNRMNKFASIQHGGDDGRYSLPAEYFGGKSNAYFPDGSSSLNLTGQLAVSRGMVHQDGKWAGPDLRPVMQGGNRTGNGKMTGGGCGCGGRRGRSRSRK